VGYSVTPRVRDTIQYGTCMTCPALPVSSSLVLSFSLPPPPPLCVHVSMQHMHAILVRLLVRVLLLFSSSKDVIDCFLVHAASPGAERDPLVRDAVHDEVPWQRQSSAYQAKQVLPRLLCRRHLRAAVGRER